MKVMLSICTRCRKQILKKIALHCDESLNRSRKVITLRKHVLLFHPHSCQLLEVQNRIAGSIGWLRWTVACIAITIPVDRHYLGMWSAFWRHGEGLNSDGVISSSYCEARYKCLMRICIDKVAVHIGQWRTSNVYVIDSLTLIGRSTLFSALSRRHSTDEYN